MGFYATSEGLVSNLGVTNAFRHLCSLQGAKRFTYAGAELGAADAADGNQMMPVIAAFATYSADQSNLGADDIPCVFSEDDASLSGVSCQFVFSESSYPPSLMLTLLDYSIAKSLEASTSPGVGNLDYLSAQLHATYDMEYELNANP